MTWQPIDTAPKDGTEILGWDGSERAVTYWYSYRIGWTEETAGHWSITALSFLGGDDSQWTPTHWQPLPAPPTEGNPEP